MLGLNDARRAGLLGGTALALIAAFGGRAALAVDECGPGAPGGTVTCTPAGNPFEGGIQYKVNDLTIVVQDGVVIDTTAKAGEPGGVVSGGAGNYGDLNVKVGTASGSGVTITTNADDADGISVATQDGSATITSYADITTSFKNGDAISAKTTAGDISITSTGDLDVDGFYGHGIRALSDTGKITITHTGDIETYGTGGFGIRAITKNDIAITVDGNITTRNSDAVLAQASAGNVTISFTGDINTKDNDSGGLDIVAKVGTVAITHAGAITTLGDRSIGIEAEGYAGVEIRSTGDISTDGKDSSGILSVSKAGGISIKSEGDISVADYGARAISAVAETEIFITSVGDLTTGGTYGAGILASTNKGSITITQTGDISTKGNGGVGISAFSNEGDVAIYATGDIATAGQADGILAYSGKGQIDIFTTGDISTLQDNSRGILAVAKDNSVFVTSAGSIVTQGVNAQGIDVAVDGDDKAAKVSWTGDISTAGEDARGITVDTSGGIGSDIEISFDGNLRTKGEDGTGIVAFADKSDVLITTSGSITTGGNFAQGIDAYGKGYTLAISAADITTSGRSATGIELTVVDDGKIALVLHGDVHTSGKTADGVLAVAENGSVAMQVNGDIITTGEASIGLTAISDKSVVMVITSDIQGGWAGIGLSINSGGTAGAGIEAGASIGALSDVAISDGADGLFLNNNGAITGIGSFGKGDEELINGGAWNLRNFQDLDGDQQRDKEAVALIDFGDDQDSFDNKGALSLSNVSGATTWDTTGQILHPGGGNSDITQEGVEQGFLLGLETFSHSGLITLADGVAGDLLVITDQAEGKTTGANVFTSNGGALALDVVLDDGSSKQSDVLILDKAETGTGATRVLISNAGGLGGQTSGDGILVVNVRDKSDADAFTLGNKPVAGAYEYHLVYQNAAKNDENWYLQSSFFDGSLEYPSIVSGALLSWYSDLNGLHDRMGERRTQVEDGQMAALPTATDIADSSAVRLNSGGDGGWLRVSGADMDIEQDGPADFDLNAVRATAGFDLGFNNILDGQDWLVLGAMAGYGWSSAGFEGGSDVDFDIATVGAYATYFRGPYYLDALVKFDWLDGEFNSENASDDVELPVFGLSLETGYRFDLTPDGFYLQPQAQLTYAHSGDDSITDNSGSRIELEDADSLRGRLGARVGQELGTNAGVAGEPVKGNFYLEAAVNQEFLGETEARVSGLTLEQELPGTTVEIGGGFDIALPKNGVTFSVDADYTLGDEAEGISATGGFRINW